MMTPTLFTIGLSSLLVISGCALSENSIGSVEEYERGSQQAVRDMLHGRYRTLDRLGITRHRTEEMRAELKRRYGIQHELDHSKSSDYVRGYNVVMSAGAKEKFGENYYDKALQAVYPESQSQFGPLRNRRKK
jgi:hypothetical protein